MLYIYINRTWILTWRLDGSVSVIEKSWWWGPSQQSVPGAEGGWRSALGSQVRCGRSGTPAAEVQARNRPGEPARTTEVIMRDGHVCQCMFRMYIHETQIGICLLCGIDTCIYCRNCPNMPSGDHVNEHRPFIDVRVSINTSTYAALSTWFIAGKG